MKVLMLILESPEDFDNRGGAAGQAYWDQWKIYSQTVGPKVVGGNMLGGTDGALTLRIRDGKRQVQDGPYADSKEALGGYMVFEVASMEEALELAASCPAAVKGAVELRPVLPMEGG